MNLFFLSFPFTMNLLVVLALFHLFCISMFVCLSHEDLYAEEKRDVMVAVTLPPAPPGVEASESQCLPDDDDDDDDDDEEEEEEDVIVVVVLLACLSIIAFCLFFSSLTFSLSALPSSTPLLFFLLSRHFPFPSFSSALFLFSSYCANCVQHVSLPSAQRSSSSSCSSHFCRWHPLIFSPLLVLSCFVLLISLSSDFANSMQLCFPSF